MAMEAFRATLAGLTALTVQVEPVNADAERDGLIRSELAAEVEGLLRGAGLAVVGQTKLFADVPGTPVLHLDVMTIRLDGRYAYSVRLELWQAVALARDPSVRALAATWVRPQLVGIIAAESLANVRAVVRSAVDEFLDDRQAAGATPCSAPARLSVGVRLLAHPALWCWTIEDEAGQLIESSWDGAWTGYATRPQAQAGGEARLDDLAAERTGGPGGRRPGARLRGRGEPPSADEGRSQIYGR